MDLQEILFLIKLGLKVQEFNRVSVKKVVDGVKTVIKFIGGTDTDGDGSIDTEEDIYTLETALPLCIDNGLTLCNSGDDVGLGYPALRLVSAEDVLPYLQDTDYTGDGNYFITDLDGDGYDDVLKPLPYDGDGDGVPDFQIVVDDDDNGLPDVSPVSPFYPIGSEGYQDIIDTYSDNVPALDKSFRNYTVTEALLFMIAFCAVIGVISKIIRRRKL